VMEFTRCCDISFRLAPLAQRLLHEHLHPELAPFPGLYQPFI
jgi:hypothetical protein